MRPMTPPQRPVLSRLRKAVPLLLAGALVLVLGTVCLPLALLLLWLRDTCGVQARAVVFLHETLGSLLWVGLSIWLHGVHELKA